MRKNMKNKKKKIVTMITMIAAMVMTVGGCMVAAAAGSSQATRNDLRSSGAIRYQEGGESVVIDTDDLYLLADKLDLFKTKVSGQLNAMQTYLSKDSAGHPLASGGNVYVVHKKPAAQDAVDPVTLDFDTILEGIAASQSIPLDPAAYGMADGTALYKTKDGKLSTSWSEDASPVSIRAATAESLSAGAAAWVNGELLLGTGDDTASACKEQAAGGETFDSYSISKGYTLPVDVASAYAYVVTTAYGTDGVDGNHAGSDPTFSVNGGGRYTKLFGQKYARCGFNVRVALYHVVNAPAGTVITGSSGLLFY